MCSRKVITWFLLAFRRSCKKVISFSPSLFPITFDLSLFKSLFTNFVSRMFWTWGRSDFEKNGSVEKTRNRSMVQNRSFFLFTLFECIGMTLNVQSKVTFNHKMTTWWPHLTFFISQFGVLNPGYRDNSTGCMTRETDCMTSDIAVLTFWLKNLT